MEVRVDRRDQVALIGAELADQYGITDDDGRRPPSYRDLFGVHPYPQFAHTMR